MNINQAVGQDIIDRALREGFRIYTIPLTAQLRVIDLWAKPGPGTARSLSIKLQADLNNNRGSVLMALQATPKDAPPAEVLSEEVPHQPNPAGV